jgi:CheY-like chemotaxis protein
MDRIGGIMAEKTKILIVDDDTVLLDLMARRLEKMGYKPDRAQNGDEALPLIEANTYDLVITDIYMPKTTGIDLITMIKGKNPETQIIAITGGAMIEIALEAIEKGADAYMSKPFDHLKIFDHTVVRALEYRKLVQYKDQIEKNGASAKGKRDEVDGSALHLAEVKKIIESIPQGLVLVDSDGEIIAANSIAEDLINFGWDVKGIDPKSFRAALNGGEGASVQLNDTMYKMKAVELPKEHGDTHILFMLQTKQGPQMDGFERAHKYLEVLKTCLSWFYKQRLREKEFRVLRAMAVQVQKLEQLHDGSYHTTRRMSGMTARLPAMQDLGRVLSEGPQ